MERSATCPGNYVPFTRADSNVWTPPAASSWEADCSLVASKSSDNIVPLVAPALVPQDCEVDGAHSTLQRSDTFTSSSFVMARAPWAKGTANVTHVSNIEA